MTNGTFEETADWLVHSPLLYLLLTLLAYRAGCWLRDRTGSSLAQPVLVTIIVVGATISVLGIEYDDYRAGTDLTPQIFASRPAQGAQLL